MDQKHPVVPFERFFAVLGYSIASFIIIGILLELASSAILSIYLRLRRDPVAQNLSPAYDGQEWAQDFWREERTLWDKAHASYEPYLMWGVKKWHGKYINTDTTEMGTYRRTTPAMGPACQKTAVRKVWVFGGSTVYGSGVPDFATIPSYLARELNRDPQACVGVINLGAEGYVTNQDVLLLIQQLKAGRRPDVAIFYGGINDAIAVAFSPDIASAHLNYAEIKAKLENRLENKLDFLKNSSTWRLIGLVMSHFRQKPFPRLSDRELAVRAQATLDNYQANQRIVQTLAAADGFRAYFIWQPVLRYGHKPLVPFEKELLRPGGDEAGRQVDRALEAVYQEAERRSSASGSFLFWGYLFDGVSEPLYLDGLHVGPRGNEMVARALAEKVQIDLFARAGESTAKH